MKRSKKEIVADINYIRSLISKYRYAVDDFEDLYGECCRIYLLLLNNCDNRKDIRPYIKKRVDWTAIDYIRTANSHEFINHTEINNNIKDKKFSHDKKIIIKFALNKLPPKKKRILELKYWKNMTNSKIAREMKMRKQTAIKLFNKAIKNMKEKLKYVQFF